MADTDGSREPLIRRDHDTVEIDFDNRDRKKINKDVVKVDFEDVIAEPDGIHSLECVWKYSYHIFTKTKHWFYRILTLIFFIPLTVILGLLFGLLSFCHIWIFTPFVKILSVCLRRPSLQVLNILGKLYNALGKMCGNMKSFFRKQA